MDEKKRQRCVAIQKKKLIELITKHPQLISCKVTQDFNLKDSQKLWKNIASELNSLPGARKTWRQWRKTWQDMRAKTKKLQTEKNGEVPLSVIMFTSAEQKALGVKTISTSYEEQQESTEFIPMEQDFLLENIDNDAESISNLSAPQSPPDIKVFTRSNSRKVKDLKSESREINIAKHTENCYFNCNTIAAQEQRKIQLKEDYLNFKKDYLRQKLKLIKEQTEALKTIAKELCNSK